MKITLCLALAAALAAGVGCSTAPQVIVSSSAGLTAGAVAPDIAFSLPEGGECTLNQARLAVAVVAFTAPPDESCCQLNPRLEALSQQVARLPVSVVQISQPSSRCPYGPGVWQVCKLREGEIIALADSSRTAWERFGEPKLGTAYLLDRSNRVAAIASLDNLADLSAQAVKLGEEAKARHFPLTPSDRVMNE